LYSDFAVPIRLDFDNDETDMWRNPRAVIGPISALLQQHGIDLDKQDCTLVRADAFPQRWWADGCIIRPTFIPLISMSLPTRVDVVAHIRNTNKYNSGYRNWPIEHATRVLAVLMRAGLKVACVGRSTTSLCVNGAIDFRDVALADTIGVMSTAGVFVGSQSGPTHLASLCQLPVVTWQTCDEHALRTSQYWNPFRVPTITMPPIDGSFWKLRKEWTPKPDRIVQAVQQLLKVGRRLTDV
jgi:hypothetical protein